MQNRTILLFLSLSLSSCGSVQINAGAAQPLPLVPQLSPTEEPLPVPSIPPEKTPILKPDQPRDPAAEAGAVPNSDEGLGVSSAGKSTGSRTSTGVGR